MDINTDSGYGRTMDLDVVLDSSQGLDVIVVLAGTADHSYQHDPSCCVVPECQHVCRWQPSLQASAWPSMVRGVTDINMYPDMALGCSSGPEDTMALGGSTGYPDCIATLAAYPKKSTWPQLLAQATSFCMFLCGNRSHRHHTKPDHNRVTGPYMAFSILGPDITMVLGGSTGLLD